MRRIGNQYGFQFDVPVKYFTTHEGASDAPPLVHGFSFGLENGRSYLNISWGSLSMTESLRPVPPGLTDFAPGEKRKIFDDKGNLIGEDSWGYLDNGERWRRVRLIGWVVASYGSVNEKDVASYGSVHEKDAELFDRVISSACLLSAPGS